MADLDAWRMWKQRCALDRCTPEVIRDLRGFAHNRFVKSLRKLGVEQGAIPTPAQAWHGFESHLALGRQRSAKAWKEWLFSRGEGEATLDRIQGGATVLMRCVVREQQRRERSPRWMQSFDAPVDAASEEGAPCPMLHELLPHPAEDPRSELEQREFLEMTAGGSDAALKFLGHRERIALAAARANLSLAHPVVVRVAQCGKSSLFNAYHRAVKTLANIISTRFPNEVPSAKAELAIRLFEQVHLQILDGLRLQKTMRPLLRLMEERR